MRGCDRAAVVVGTVAAVLLGGCKHRELAPPLPFAQVQSFLEDFGGMPVLAANWSGHFRPYAWRGGRFEPLLPPAAEAALADADLYNPTPLSDHELVLAGQPHGHREYELYLLDTATATVTNLTQTPDIDEGSFCVDVRTRRIAYTHGTAERFATVEGGKLVEVAGASGPELDHCVFDAHGDVIGATRGAAHAIIRCVFGQTCEPAVLDPMVRGAVGFFTDRSGAMGVLAAAPSDAFRRAYVLEGDHAIATGPAADGDVLDYDGSAARIGKHARYASTLAPSAPLIVSKQRKIGGVYYAIVADDATTRTLAELTGGSWVLHPAPNVATRITTPLAPEELWLATPDGGRHQAFYFAAASPGRAVVWLHGGPQENVSPRYSPYFAALNRLGFAVLALNYPGSTGQGRAYEAEFDERHVGPAVEVAFDQLKQRGATVIVTWSVSTGSRVQRMLLRRGLAPAAIVDQAGFDNRDLVELVRGKIPYFSIRGAFDEVGEARGFDYVYAGAHDITNAAQFDAMLVAIEPFLTRLGDH